MCFFQPEASAEECKEGNVESEGEQPEASTEAVVRPPRFLGFSPSSVFVIFIVFLFCFVCYL